MEIHIIVFWILFTVTVATYNGWRLFQCVRRCRNSGTLKIHSDIELNTVDSTATRDTALDEMFALDEAGESSAAAKRSVEAVETLNKNIAWLEDRRKDN